MTDDELKRAQLFADEEFEIPSDLARALVAEVVRLRLIARAAENCIAYMGNRRQDEMVESLSKALGVDFTDEPAGGGQ